MLPPLTIATVVDPGVRLTLPERSAAVVKAPTPDPNFCTSGVLMPNSTAAVNANRPPRTAGKREGDRLVEDEMLTRADDHQSIEDHAEWQLSGKLYGQAPRSFGIIIIYR